MRAKHTPGPWNIRAKRLGAVVMIDAAPHVPGVIAQVCATTGDDGTNLTAAARNDANARLIAAAPELLDLVRAYSGTVQPVTLAKLDKLAQALLARIDGE